jgi:hypothetical protein
VPLRNALRKDGQRCVGDGCVEKENLGGQHFYCG